LEFRDKTFVLGVGAQKAGTSWLFEYLSGRGDIYMPRKELHFFDAKFGPLARRKRRRIRQRATGAKRGKNEMLAIKSQGDPGLYRKYFESRIPAHLKLFGEISPSYALIGEDGFRAVRELFPNVRVIFLMRDPISRFYSQLRMEIGRRGTTRALKRIAGKRRSELLARSRYEQTLQSLDQVFAPSEVLCLFYETLFCRNSIQSLCRFLDVPYAEPDFQKIVNASESETSPVEEDVIAELGPTYRYCRERFGPGLPATWSQLD